MKKSDLVVGEEYAFQMNAHSSVFRVEYVGRGDNVKSFSNRKQTTILLRYLGPGKARYDYGRTVMSGDTFDTPTTRAVRSTWLTYINRESSEARAAQIKMGKRDSLLRAAQECGFGRITADAVFATIKLDLRQLNDLKERLQ